MPKMIISIDGVVIKEVQITKDRTSLGRRPYNDIVIDNLAVSGEHAVLEMKGSEVWLEDQNSTNGTYINGKAVKRQQLHHNDAVEIGKYRIKFVAEGAVPQPSFDKTQIFKPGSTGMGGLPASAPTQPASLAALQASANAAAASIKVVSGSAAGREVPLTKVVTTIGKPGVAVAAITRRPTGYVLTHVDGATRAALNGNALGSEAASLKNGDVIELAGTQMQFVQA